MKSKIHIVMRNDLVILPPMQSLITVLLEKGVQVHFLGKCSDIERKSYFARLGVVFEDVIYTPQDKIYKTLLEQIRYRRLLKQYLSVNMNNDTDITTNIITQIYITTFLRYINEFTNIAETSLK